MVGMHLLIMMEQLLLQEEVYLLQVIPECSRDLTETIQLSQALSTI